MSDKHSRSHDASPETPHDVFLTGATGYVGGRLAPRLLDAGHRVRALTRSAEKLRSRPWSGHQNLEIVEADASDEDRLAASMEGCDAAYYLIHSMEAAGSAYAERDRLLAEAFARAAARAGVGRILYLGGLGETGDDLSEHLSSRREVEDALASTEVPVTVLRAAMIIGSGSASFEILRYLTERLPLMVTPRWVRTKCQPIGIRNVLGYLEGCLDSGETVGRTFDVGGPDVVTYEELMQTMAKALGLRRRLVIPVPVLTPKLSSLWIHLVTPLSHRIARPLAEGLRNEVVCRDETIRELVPQRLLGVSEAIERALGKVEEGAVESTWRDAGPMPGDPDWAGGTTFEDRHEIHVDAGPEEVFRAVCRIGGGNGWYAGDVLWRIRGLLDRLVGGPGLRRGRNDPEEIAYGDALDFWRVTGLERNRHLALRAEMKLPGEAMLAFDVEDLAPAGEKCTRLVQTARFQPRGLLGLLYWYAVLPFHGFVFRGMLEGIRREAEGATR